MTTVATSAHGVEQQSALSSKSGFFGRWQTLHLYLD